MMCKGNNTILDRLGVKMATTVTVGQQDCSGKYATVGQHCCEREEEKEVVNKQRRRRRGPGW